MQPFPDAVRRFAEVFASMQKRRHRADYAPDDVLRKSAVVHNVDRTERAIREFEEEPNQIRRAFAAYVLFQSRKD